MSMFFCAACGGLRDSDDGCEEYGSRGTELICIDCINERPDEGEEPDTDVSVDGIYRKLKAMGCPDDIAHELAREKGK